MKKVCVIPLFCLGLWLAPPHGASPWVPQARAASIGQDADSSALQSSMARTSTTDASTDDTIPADVWERIRRGYKMPPTGSPLVDKWVKYYAQDHADYLDRMFNRSGRYLYQVIEDVEARGLPTELALLPFVESAFQPEALSKAKASGLWQFMPATGKTYDLAQNRWRDERKDILESTRAALDYFQYLYGLFNDWHLALAAYNWGEGSVQRAIKRAQAQNAPTDYVSLRMPNETANYVPKLEAIKLIVSNPEKYGVTLPDVGNEPYFVTITKPRDIDTSIAAQLARMDEGEFRALNPSFKLPVIVAAHDNLMHLPAERVDSFVDNLASWMDSGQKLSHWTTYVMGPSDTLASVAKKTGMTEAELREVNAIPRGRKVMANSTLLVKAGADQEDITIAAADASLTLTPETTWRRVTYRVRRGDTLDSIAARWHIDTKSIIRTNRLRSGRLARGQRLILTVPNVSRTPIQVAEAPAKAASEAEGKVRLHSVRSGESLTSIANRYDISLDELRAANPKLSSRIQAGQRVRVPTEGESIEVPKFWVVKRGDTLMEISRQTGASVSQLQRANRLSNAHLHVGQKIEIPNTQETRTPAVNRKTKGKSAKRAADDGAAGAAHIVRRGETMGGIARHYGVSVLAIQQANGKGRSTRVRVGEALEIPLNAGADWSKDSVSLRSDTEKASTKLAPSSTERLMPEATSPYVVRRGDTLSSIARRYGTSVAAIRRASGLRSSRLKVGQSLSIPLK